MSFYQRVETFRYNRELKSKLYQTNKQTKKQNTGGSNIYAAIITCYFESQPTYIISFSIILLGGP